ncbi:hypothetical protein F4859DRAFT_458007 [Xylaria cf. heliscus]|nr:hypothetical protein F4859DRAFT_458007 [Xylaria cf. heliscus]
MASPSQETETKMICPTNISSICCAALTALLGEQKVAGPGSAAYNSSLQSYFTAQQSSTQPACIVQPVTSHDVSQAIKYLTAQDTAYPFAVRSGGHAFWAGESSITGGVIIDLRALNSITLSKDNSTALVGVGNTWDAVYEKLDPLQLSVNGGRSAGVGVGGLTLGGGISFFSPRYGWTCDTVSNFEVVLADGSIVNANDKSHPDLFFALKGGNNNFGIVTRVDLATFEQGPVWVSTVYNPITSVDEVAEEFVKLNTVDTYDEYSSYYTTFAYAQAMGVTLISSDLEYTKAVDGPYPAVYKGYMDLPNLGQTTDVVNMTALSQKVASVQPPAPRRALFRVATLLSTKEVVKVLYNHWNASLPAITNVPDMVWSLVMEPLPPAIYARAANSNAMGLGDRTKPYFVALLSVTWKNAEDDKLVSATAEKLMDGIVKEAHQFGGADPFIYLNYADESQDPISSYGAESVRRLIQVQQKYDPKGVFTFQVPGGYKIPGVKRQ